MKKKQPISLGREQELDLIKRAQAGDRQAKQELLDAHTPFVAAIINKEFTLPEWMSKEDILQEGRIGLLDAIERFDVTSGLRLITYAYWRIKKAIVGHMSEMGYMAKVPFTNVVKLKKIANRLELGLSEDVEGDTRIVNNPNNTHIMSLIVGCLPINPTEVGQGNDEDSRWAAVESQLVSADPAEGVIGSILSEGILKKLGEMTVYEGHMLALHLGLMVTEEPTPLKYIAGDRSKVMRNEDDLLDVTSGWNGFGLQIGETYNSCSRLIKQSEEKFRSLLRSYFGIMYHDYLESDEK